MGRPACQALIYSVSFGRQDSADTFPHDFHHNIHDHLPIIWFIIIFGPPTYIDLGTITHNCSRILHTHSDLLIYGRPMRSFVKTRGHHIVPTLILA